MGGAYVTADMLKFWAALFNNEILGKEYTRVTFNSPHSSK